MAEIARPSGFADQRLCGADGLGADEFSPAFLSADHAGLVSVLDGVFICSPVVSSASINRGKGGRALRPCHNTRLPRTHNESLGDECRPKNVPLDKISSPSRTLNPWGRSAWQTIRPSQSFSPRHQK